MFGTVLATKDDFASFMFVSADNLPPQSEALLQRASDLVYIAMGQNFVESKDSHVAVAKLATCAQAQDWLKRELDGVSENRVSEYSLGDLSVRFADDDVSSLRLCKLAARYLHTLNLLYRGR